ncbi:CapA family protein [Hassallia byssoidea VB512170]|uniref:CapA family protein n=1 Tax=Hassallia byssoidea VB512170 TaxID=1304833 RepID=A0A846HD76_9CYAN|nr:CapA family protein [Hassalia byssoidea]NEU74739.1 CapA family protein [Hassalia byssoidea VB512170]
MANRIGRLLPLSFISFCFCVGISIGIFVRFGQVQRSQAATSEEAIPLLPGYQPEYTPPPSFDLPESDYITIQAVGDVIPGTNYPNHRLPRDRNQLIPKSVRAYLQRADLLLGNLETSLTTYPYSSKDINQGQIFAFRSPPAYAQLFADVGFDVFNMANNHALDFGKVGFRDTVNNLATVGIETLGHKNQILYKQVRNVPVAMIGFTTYDIYNSMHDLETAKALVQEARANANLVIISMQAGAEGTGAMHVKNKTEYFYGEDRGNSMKFARTMIDAGADLVIGHGPHVPRAMEIYKGKLIAYSLGNFLGYRTLSTEGETSYSMILEVKMNSDGELIGSKIIPVRMNKQGIPQIDQRFRTVSLLRYLNKNAFPDKPMKINKKGEIVLANIK